MLNTVKDNVTNLTITLDDSKEEIYIDDSSIMIVENDVEVEVVENFMTAIDNSVVILENSVEIIEETKFITDEEENLIVIEETQYVTVEEENLIVDGTEDVDKTNSTNDSSQSDDSYFFKPHYMSECPVHNHHLDKTNESIYPDDGPCNCIL